MTKYLTAKQIGILPEERKALVAFVKARHSENKMRLNGGTHYYDQSFVDDPGAASEHGCGTAGCIAGYVFAHARRVQGKRSLRGARTVDSYINKAWDEDANGNFLIPALGRLYVNGSHHLVPEAKRVVKKMLRTGKADWY